MAKRGPKPDWFKQPWSNNDAVNGLVRKDAKRWRAYLPDGTVKEFRCDDPREAVVRFRQLEAKQLGRTVDFVLTSTPKPAEGQPDEKRTAAFQQIVDAVQTAETKLKARHNSDGSMELVQQFDETAYINRVRQDLLERPEWIAKMTGIEWVGWHDHTKPKPSPTLDEVGKAYFDRNDVSEKEIQKCETVWKEFKKTTGAETLRDLTPEMVAKYGQAVNKLGLAPKSICHRYNRVKTVFGNFMHTGRDIEGTRRALDCCQVLKSPTAVSLDPHPISRSNLQKLLGVAEGEQHTLLLLALNLCFYPVDVARLKWEHLDLERGVYFMKRGKTKVARAAVLWGRTIEGLKAISKSDDDTFVFHSELSGRCRPHTDNTVRKLFADLRRRAGLGDEVQFADIRDGSFTAAVAGEGVEFQHARVLAGHRSGIADAYVLRNPAMTAKACAAVEKHYFG